MAKTYKIDNIPAELLPQVGGKARGLHLLKKYGYNVPDAFIVTDVAGWEQQENPWREAREEFTRLGCEEAAVRSSATLEDGRDFSAAGQFSTVLNVRGEGLEEAIAACVGSLHSKTATHYSREMLRSAECQMTVVVQRMVKPRCAGVLFSRAPMIPSAILIEAVEGLGENLVSGKVAAQQYRVADGTILTMPENAYLSKEEVLALAEQGKRAENLFGMPMDLEWAIDGKGEICWLQARPITVEGNVGIDEFNCHIGGEDHVYTLGNIGEVMPGAVTPLNLSTNMLALDYGVKATFAQVHCIDIDKTPAYTFISTYYNHVFFNMNNMYLTNHQVYGNSKKSLDIIMCGRELSEYPEPYRKQAPVWKKVRNTVLFLQLVFGGEKARKGMDEAIEKVRFDLTADIKGIYRQILDVFPSFLKVHYYHYCTSYYSGGTTNILMRRLEKYYQDRNTLQSLMAGSLTEIEDFESANVLRMMRKLADEILAEKPEAKGYTAVQLGDYLEHQAGEQVRQSYNIFLQRHGHRGIREMEIRSLSWNQNRESFYTSLQSVITSTNQSHADVSVRHWQEYADELMSMCTPREKKSLMKSVLNARKGVCYREYTKSKLVYALDQYKQAYRKLAEQMAAEGMLPDVDAIYFLTQEEVGRLIEGESALVKKAIARRRIFPQFEEMNFPFVTKGIPQPIVAKSSSNAASFNGTPVSRGIAKGRARVVRCEKDATQLQQGEIMVAESTDIGWTPYYNTIAGLVTEIGSALSHGIVVAREYALPSVVNVSNVMNEIHTGDMVTIDGNTGTVSINRRSEVQE